MRSFARTRADREGPASAKVDLHLADWRSRPDAQCREHSSYGHQAGEYPYHSTGSTAILWLRIFNGQKFISYQKDGDTDLYGTGSAWCQRVAMQSPDDRHLLARCVVLHASLWSTSLPLSEDDRWLLQLLEVATRQPWLLQVPSSLQNFVPRKQDTSWFYEHAALNAEGRADPTNPVSRATIPIWLLRSLARRVKVSSVGDIKPSPMRFGVELSSITEDLTSVLIIQYNKYIRLNIH